MEPRPMRLIDVGIYLRDMSTEQYPQGVAIALELGNHDRCLIHTNCPEAVKLRKALTEMGLKWQDIVDDWNAKRVATPPREVQIPDIDGKVSISVGGQSFELDLEAEIQRQARHALSYKVEEYRLYKRTLTDIGRNLWNRYLDDMFVLREQAVLPALCLPIGQMIKHRCMLTKTPPMSGRSNAYALLFPFSYAPQWIVTRTSGTTLRDRYSLHPDDQAAIKHEDVWIMYTIQKNMILTPAPLLLNSTGRKFIHYHGDGYDCWGEVRLPEHWDGSIDQLVALTRVLEASIATINRDSLMRETPENMPNFVEMFKRATKEGQEGKISKKKKVTTSEPMTDQPSEPIVETDSPDVPVTGTTVWGERR